jgi:hypothetical protein
MKKAFLIAAIFHLFSLTANAENFACGRMNCPSASDTDCKLDEMLAPHKPLPHQIPEASIAEASALHGQCVCVKGYSYFWGRELDFKIVERMFSFKGDELCSAESAGYSPIFD